MFELVRSTKGPQAPFLIAVSLLGCSDAPIGTPETAGSAFETPTLYAADYHELLNLYPLGSLGFGPDPFSDMQVPSPPVYGLILSAESLRLKAAGFEDELGKARIEEALGYLLEHKDDDQDGIPGWGLNFAWDAFGDGSVNSAATAYTIDTAFILESLLEAHGLSFISAAHKQQMKDLFYALAIGWPQSFFSLSAEGGYFWYSSNPADNVYVANVSSMFSGALARLIAEHPDLFVQTELDNLRNLLQASAKMLMDTRSSDGLTWRYSSQVSIPNDLLHQVYTLTGLLYMKQFLSLPEVTFDGGAAVESLMSYYDGERIWEYSSAYRVESVEELAHRPARIWGVAGMIEMLARHGEPLIALDLLAVVKRDYGVYPRIMLYPADYSANDTFYPRIAIRLVRGLAYLYFAPRP